MLATFIVSFLIAYFGGKLVLKLINKAKQNKQPQQYSSFQPQQCGYSPQQYHNQKVTQSSSVVISQVQATSPGMYLDSWLEQTGVGRTNGAILFNMEPAQLDAFISGQLPLTQEMAQNFERMTRVPASTWLTLEANYRDNTRFQAPRG